MIYVITNVYETVIVKHETPISDMKDFIENQQYREDQLRYQCNLENYIIAPKKSIYENIIDDMKNALQNIQKIHNVYYPALNDSPILIKSYDDLIEQSHQNKNINRRLIYNDNIYLLKNNHPLELELELDDLILTVNKIKFDNYY